jgi:hypothetical protein
MNATSSGLGGRGHGACLDFDSIRRATGFDTSTRRVDASRRQSSLPFHVETFGRVFQTMRLTPAMEAGLSGHVWTIEDIAGPLG